MRHPIPGRLLGLAALAAGISVAWPAAAAVAQPVAAWGFSARIDLAEGDEAGEAFIEVADVGQL